MTRDVEYMVDKDHTIQLIDQFTGRIMPGREYNDGLQQAIQAKEGVEIKQETVVLATITYQNFFQTDAAINQITETLRDQHGITYANEDDFSIFSQSDLLDTFDVITGTLTAFLGAIAEISLVVGGIGIMNIMLVSVTERTREIGIRKAVGALKRDILVQFLMESILLSVVGGLLGVTLGWLMATVAGQLIDLETVVDGGTVLLATGFAASVGLVFGIYPAWRAASLRPIEALRYE